METETHHLVVNTARLKALSTTLYIVVYCILCSCCSMPILHPSYDVVRSVNEATLATTPFDFEFRVPAGQTLMALIISPMSGLMPGKRQGI